VRIDRDRGGLNASGRCAADLAVRRAAAVHAPGIHGRQVGACSVPRRIACVSTVPRAATRCSAATARMRRIFTYWSSMLHGLDADAGGN